MTRVSRRGSLGLALVIVVAFGGLGAAKVPAAGTAPTGLCIPLLMSCGTTPTPPTPTSNPAPPISVPIPVPVAPILGAPTVPPGGTSPVTAVADTNAPTFTLPAAQLGGSSIEISGLRSVTVVTVPLADGTRTPVLKIMADDVAVNDFLLDVRRATGPSLVTNSSRMELKGNVQVYLDSLTATLLDGTGLTLGAATPPPGGELPSSLLRVNLGLVGVTANSITFTSPHQQIHE